MEQAITTSESGIPKKTYILLLLNVLGVIGCIFLTVFLVLWALCIVFPEPNTAPIILDFISTYKKNLTHLRQIYSSNLDLQILFQD